MAAASVSVPRSSPSCLLPLGCSPISASGCDPECFQTTASVLGLRVCKILNAFLESGSLFATVTWLSGTQALCCIVLLSLSVTSDSWRPHELQHTRLPYPSPTPGACSNSCPLSQWCHPTISSSVVPFSSCLQSFPASGSFLMSPLFASVGQSIGASASTSVFSMNIQDWSPLGWTGWISLQSKGLSRVFPNNTVQSINSLMLSFLYGYSHIHTWPLEKP